MVQFYSYLKLFWQANTWLVSPLSVLGIAVLFTYISHLLYQRVHPRLTKRGYFVTSALLEAIHWPFIAAIWVKALAILLRISTLKLDDTLLHMAWKLLDVGLILLVALVVIRFIKLFEEQLLLGHLTKKYPDATTVRAMGKLMRVGAIIIVLLFILPLLGANVSGIWAFGGGSAIVLGIGAREIFTNYFGGLVIYADRNFKVGDWICSPDKKIEGKVEDIGWRVTQIRTVDQRSCYIPNAVLSSIIVVNASQVKNRLIQEAIAIRYTDVAVLDKIIQEVRSMLQGHSDIDQRKLVLAHFTEISPPGIKLHIYAFTKTTDRRTYQDVKQGILFSLIQIIEQYGTTLALPRTPPRV